MQSQTYSCKTLTAHSLRHTAGTLALRTGSDLRQVQDLLGHADPHTTSIYAHVGDRWINNPGNDTREIGVVKYRPKLLIWKVKIWRVKKVV